jgi:hypothetical protein
VYPDKETLSKGDVEIFVYETRQTYIKTEETE